MRGLRSLLLLVVVALGLGTYIYFVEAKKNPDDNVPKHDKVFSVAADKISEIDIHAATGETTTLKKSGTDWQITAPAAMAADQSAAGSVASSLESLQVEDSIEDNPPSVAQYGLEPPRVTVTFRATGDDKPHTVQLGSKTPTGSDIYARVAGQPKLFLIASYLDDTFNRTPFQLRDKTALAFNRDTTDEMTVDTGSGAPLSLNKKGGEWYIHSGTNEMMADYGVADSLLSRISGAQMKAVVSGQDGAAPSAADLKKYGLDKPALVATVGSGSSKASIAIGGKQDDSSLYARDLSKSLIFTVESALLTDLKKSPDDLRSKDVFQFKSFDAISLDLTRGGTTTTFGQAKPAGGDAKAADVWKQTKPTEKDVNQTGMTDLLNTLSSLKADHFVDKAAASGEDTTVSVAYGDTKMPSNEKVTFRKTADAVQVIVPDQPGAAVVATADFDKAISQFKDLTGQK